MSSDGPASPRISPVAARVPVEAGVRVIAAAAAGSGLSVASLLARDRRLSRPRWAAMLVLRDLGLSLPLIGRRMRRDHTTVMHGVAVARELMATEPAFAALVAQVQARAGEPLPPAEQI